MCTRTNYVTDPSSHACLAPAPSAKYITTIMPSPSSIHDLINAYYETKPNFSDYIPSETSTLETEVQRLNIDDEQENVRRLILYLGSRDILEQRRNEAKQPHS